MGDGAAEDMVLGLFQVQSLCSSAPRVGVASPCLASDIYADTEIDLGRGSFVSFPLGYSVICVYMQILV